MIHRLCRLLIGLFLGIFLVLILGEGIIRVAQHITLGPAGFAREDFYQRIVQRLYEIWTREAQSDRFVPPFLVYADEGWTDENRLQKIFETTKLEPNKSWESHDFLRPEALREQTTYHIFSNSLGFRGPERKIKKSARTFRIIALGDYHTFGHGVEYAQTYCARLEAGLQKKYPDRQIEVWNEGRDAGTAIVGLARLKHEVLSEHPDMLILDYGFVDPITWSDNLMVSTLFLPDDAGGRWLKRMLLPLAPLISNSILIQKIQARLLSMSYAKKADNFFAITREMLSIANREGIPVILVKQLENYVDDKGFYSLTGPRVGFIKTVNAFARNPAPRELYFSAQDSWITEVDPAARSKPDFWNWPYRLDFYQLNDKGHQVLANAIEEKVDRYLSSGSFQPSVDEVGTNKIE
jgi:hypothetical protein